jgi:DNA-binding NarL/FixJ family response regulator
MSKTVDILIVDDHLLMADGLEQILQQESHYRIIGKALNGKQLMQMLNGVYPDLILLDISMPFLNGFDASLAIRKILPQVKIVLISMHYDAKVRAFAKENGLNGFIVKTAGTPALKQAIAEVLAGKFCCIEPELTTMEAPDKKQEELILKFKISTREKEIISLINKGMASKEIAEELHLSILTVDTHRKNILRKLQIRNAAELISFAMRNGIV